MPDIVVHTNFGAKIARRLMLDVNHDVYNFGLLGPDPYLFYHFYMKPLSNRVNKYSSVMHREHTGDFLTALAIRAKDDHDVFSYLAGFLCHYALDSTTHPYINEMADDRISMHIAIEHRLDLLSGDNVRIPPFLPELLREPVGGAIEKVYGFENAWDRFKQGRRDMKPFYAVVTDKNGALDRWARKVPKLNRMSYKSHVTDGMDLSGFVPLYNKALGDAQRLIEAARSFVNGECDEKAFAEVIGNRSYIDG